jgi:molecular chaperone GrpE (heat shock protein)
MTAQMDRDQMLRRLEQLLDAALADETLPTGIDPGILSAVAGGEDSEAGRRCDSYSLWAAMTALTQEVKLQGRAFLELNHTLDARTLEAQTSRMIEELRAAYAERERNLQREAERRCRREALSALIDLRDRLARGRESARAAEPEMQNAATAGWFKRLFSRPGKKAAETVEALVRGYVLGIERLDQTLDEFHVREIRCQGEIFDPRLMNAIDSEESSTAPAGQVLEVYRSGYEWNGEVFRPAQVKVSRAAAPGKIK